MSELSLESVMGLILNSGDGKSHAVEAIRLAKEGKFDAANEEIELAHQALISAHKSQTSLLTQEASGDNVELSLLMVHAQDHLMTTITFIDLAKEIIDLHKLKS